MPHVPELHFSRFARRFLESCDDLAAIYAVLHSLLLDPHADNHHKFSRDYVPYAPGAHVLIDDTWHIAYRIHKNGDVTIVTIDRIDALKSS